jgi:hypothetical protein
MHRKPLRWKFGVDAGVLLAGLLTGLVLALAFPLPSLGAESFVYNIIRGVDLGNEGESPQRDFYVNIGSSQGVRAGDDLEVLRRMPSYDATNQKLYRDITFPVARLTVIHAEGNAAIARLDKMLPPEKVPVIEPHSVMIGDLVRKAR